VKKIGVLTILILATVLCAMVFSVAAAGPKAAATPMPAAVPAPSPAAAVPADHPHIHEALDSMHAARHSLEIAEHDFDGHRQKAIEHLDAAIHEAEICQGMR
jgi:hypothetical protein